MKVYTLEEARLMHSIGIRMRCISDFPYFIKPASILMEDVDHICCVDTRGYTFDSIKINEDHNRWVKADDI